MCVLQTARMKKIRSALKSTCRAHAKEEEVNFKLMSNTW